MTGTTIGSGMTLTAGYTITPGDGNGFALTNLGVIGTTTAGFAVVAQTTGDFIYNSGKMLASTATGEGIFAPLSIRITNRTGGLISASTGIQLGDGGTIDNASGGSITGLVPISGSGAPVSVNNYGVITGTGTSSTQGGVVLTAGGYVYNKPGGSISGANGVYESVFAKVRNEGAISGNNAVGVELNGGGTVTTETQTPNSAATISGSYAGIVINGASGYVLDASGQISGGAGGVFLQAGGYIHQIGGPGGGPGGGTITANYAVAINNGPGTVDTGGRILGTKLGVGMDGAGPHKVTLSSIGATISGTEAISISGGSGYIYTQGTINAGASGTAVSMAGGYNNLLEIYSGAKIIGNVNGGNFQAGSHTTTLLLAAGFSFGTLTGFGSRYYNIGNVTVKSGATWTMDSTDTFVDPSFVSAGSTTFSPVTVLDAGTLTFGGSEFARLTLGSKASLTVTKGGVFTPAYLSTAIYAPIGAASPTVVTDGQITAAGNDGIRLNDGGTVTNQADGVISAKFTGVLVQTAKGIVTNDGLIRSTITYGIALGAGGTVANTGGTITGTLGVGIYGGAGIVTNTGQISGTSDTGVKLKAGGTVTNTGGTIKGTLGVDIIGGAGMVTNTGKITGSGSNDGVALEDGGSVFNQAGTISGLGGIFIAGGAGTVTNYGQITGTSIYSVNLPAGFTNRLRIKPGASFSGNFVNGGNTAGSTSVSTIELLSATSAGTLNGVGSAYQHFANITIDSGANWTIGPTGSIVAYQTLVDSGTVTNEVFVASEVTLANGTFINASGYLSGADGVVGASGTNVVVNNSNIRATQIGVSFATAGRVTNQSDGFIGGRLGVYIAEGPASVVNQGLIEGYEAVYLPKGGSVDNQSGGFISSRVGVVISGGNGTVTNAGTIVSVGDYGVILPDHGANRLVLDPGSTIAGLVHGGLAGTSTSFSTLELASGSSAGTIGGIGSKYMNFPAIAVDAGAKWTLASGQTIAASQALTDNGTLTNDAAVMTAILLESGAMLSNASGATISAATGVQGVGFGGAATVVNDGMIKGSQAVSTGIQLTTGGGRVTNQAGGVIAAQGGVYLQGASNAVVNYGLIHGPGVAVYLLNGGSVSNHVGGTIEGIPGISVRQGAGTVTNSGVIVGYTGTAVSFGAGFQNLLAISPGAAFIGVVNGGNTSASGTAFSTLELMPGVRAGALSGFGTRYLNFQDIQVDQYASWTLAAGQVIPAAVGLIDEGTLTNDATLLTNVPLYAGAVLTNASGATISADPGVFSLGNQASPSTVVNYGLIDGGDYQGVRLLSGGSVTNRAGTIKGLFGVGIDFAAGTVTNSGFIAGSGGTAVSLGTGFANRVIVDPGAVFQGAVYGGGNGTLELASGSSAGTVAGNGSKYSGFDHVIVDPGAAWTLASGTVTAAGTAVSDSGTLASDAIIHGLVTLSGTAAFTNAVAGVILGGPDAINPVSVYGVLDYGTPGVTGVDTVVNAGLISLHAAGAVIGADIDLRRGGSVTNQQNATITADNAIGATAIEFGFGPGTVTNAGMITVNGLVILEGSGGTVVNESGGVISGTFGVDLLAGAGTVTNAGTIAGSDGTAVLFGGDYTNRLILDPGATFTGTVDGGNSAGGDAVSTLEMAAGTAGAYGTLSGVGSHYVGFQSFVVDSSATWNIEAGQQFAATYTLTDNGILLNDATVLSGVTIGAGAYLYNAAGATISGANVGVLAMGAAASVMNYGTIKGGSYGASLTGGNALVTNRAGVISGDVFGVTISGGTGTVLNNGAIVGANAGVVLSDGGTVASAGSIDGFASDGVIITGGAGTVTNYGEITGGDGTAVSLAPGFRNQVLVNPGAVFHGVVDGGNTIGASHVSTLEFGNLYGVSGTLSGLDGQYINFGQIRIDAGASWAVAGAPSLAAGITLTNSGTLTVRDGALNASGSVINYGLIQEFNGTLTVGTLSGTGQVLIGTGDTVTASGSVAAGQTVVFGGGGVLALVPGSFSGQIDGLRGGGTIELTGITGATGAGIVNGDTLAIQQSAGPVLDLTLDPTQSYAGAIFPIVTLNGHQFVEEAPLTGPTVIDQGETVSVTGAAGSAMAAITGASGGITVTGVNALLSTTTGTFAVGDSGLGGLAIEAGGTVTTANNAVVGNTSGASGSSVQLTGAGSNWQVGGALSVGQSSAGELSVGAGSTVVATGFVAIGMFATDGSIDVIGAGAGLRAEGLLDVGIFGTGALSIDAGATVTAEAYLTAGDSAAAVGQINLDGAGSSLNVVYTALIGNVGNGALSLLNGAVFSAANLTIGDLAGSSGTLSLGTGATVTAGTLEAGVSSGAVGQIGLSGAGTGLSITGDAVVAGSGTGVLSVLSGATFSASGLTIGANKGGSGAVIVSGAGSDLAIAGVLNIGSALGAGDLTVGPSAAVHASVINLEGQAVLEGGLLDPSVTVINPNKSLGGSGTVASGDIIDEGILQAGDGTPGQLELVQGTIVGGGTLTENGSKVANKANAVGVLQINTFGTMEVDGAVLNAATTTFANDVTPATTYTVTHSVIDVNFEDSTGVLQLDDIAGFGGTIASFQAGDQFIITGGTLSGLGVNNGSTLTMSDSGNGGADQIIFGSPVSASYFNIVAGNTIEVVACFASGTLIETVDGPVAVEALHVGDRVLTYAGISEPVVWIGSRAVNCLAHPARETVWPVRVSAGAFGRNVPVRDLYLSPDHAVFVNGVLVPVKLLVNGTSISQVRRDRVVYHHVELPEHAVILAEGLAVESYLHTSDRNNFDGDGTVRLFPDFAYRLTPDAAKLWEARGAAPLVMTGEELAAARRLIMEARVACSVTASSTRDHGRASHDITTPS